MPNQADIAIIKKPQPATMAISAIAIVAGVGIILWWASKQPKGGGGLIEIAPGELMGPPHSPSLDTGGQITVPIGTPIIAATPKVVYQGPGRDTYTYLRVVQNRGGVWVTVYGSGVAGVHIGPATQPTEYPLVGATQPQPAGCPALAICAYTYPGPEPTPICGAPPVPGVGTVLLEIYQRKAPEDGDDGFASPTCGAPGTNKARKPIRLIEYRDKILFR